MHTHPMQCTHNTHIHTHAHITHIPIHMHTVVHAHNTHAHAELGEHAQSLGPASGEGGQSVAGIGVGGGAGAR